MIELKGTLADKPHFTQSQVDYLVIWLTEVEAHHNFKEDSIDKVALCTAEHCGMRRLVSHVQDVVISQEGGG